MDLHLRPVARLLVHEDRQIVETSEGADREPPLIVGDDRSQGGQDDPGAGHRLAARTEDATGSPASGESQLEIEVPPQLYVLGVVAVG